MGYFSNSTEFDFWAASNCYKCHNFGTGDDGPACPVEMAHTLYAYELCNETDHPGKVMLDMLIPRNKNDLGNAACTMFRPRNGVTEKHLRDWDRYKAIMAEASALRTVQP